MVDALPVINCSRIPLIVGPVDKIESSTHSLGVNLPLDDGAKFFAAINDADCLANLSTVRICRIAEKLEGKLLVAHLFLGTSPKVEVEGLLPLTSAIV